MIKWFWFFPFLSINGFDSLLALWILIFSPFPKSFWVLFFFSNGIDNGSQGISHITKLPLAKGKATIGLGVYAPAHILKIKISFAYLGILES